MGLLGKLSAGFEKHKLARRLLLTWACWLISWTAFRVFEDVSKITSPVATALGIIVGILATVIGFYQWLRGKEDRENVDNDRN